MRMRMDTAAGNRVLQAGKVDQLLRDFAERTKPEAAYFFPDQGKRAASFVFDMKDSSEIIALVEPFFQEIEAEIQLTPVMNLEDLQRGLAAFSS